MSAAGFLSVDSRQFGPDRALLWGRSCPPWEGPEHPCLLPTPASSTLPVVIARNVSGCCQKTFSPEATSPLGGHPWSTERGLG